MILYLEEEGSAEVRALVEEAEVHAALARAAREGGLRLPCWKLWRFPGLWRIGEGSPTP